MQSVDVFPEQAAVPTAPQDGIAVCLSGGGFRATLFNLGSLWRLNEAGLLFRAKLITSVSGGSIASAKLALEWNQLRWAGGVATDFSEKVSDPVRRFCSRDIAAPSALKGLLTLGRSVGDEMTRAYEALFGRTTLQDFPDAASAPAFVLYATSLQTGRSVRMSKAYLADYRVGILANPRLSVAQAVAASSAFPPFLSPQIIETDPAAWERNVQGADCSSHQWKRRLVLTDGGVYDNMGLETAWHRFNCVLVSDAGAPFKPEVDPPVDWLKQPIRVSDILTDQTRALRRRWLIEDFKAKKRSGTYWGIRGSIADYHLPGAIATDSDLTRSLASIRTNLDPFSDEEQGHLINWGYVMADTALRRWVPKAAGPVPGIQPVPQYAI